MSTRDTTILNPTDLRYLLIDCLNLYSRNTHFIEGNNPYLFTTNNNTFYIYIKNVHESGRGRGNEDECRIQIARSKEISKALSSKKTVIVLGYFHDYKVFTAWNPLMMASRFNVKKTISLYSRFSTHKKALEAGISNYIDNNNQSIISFSPKYLGLYLENIENIHSIDENQLQQLISKSDESDSEDKYTELHIKKHKFTITHKQYKRDPKFRKIIYQAYNNRCAMCGIKLGIVIAAHIIPHADPDGTDEVDNGICLCPLHHDAYDSGIVYFDENFKIKLNQEKIRYLEKMDLDSGIKKFEELTFEEISLPENMAFRPTSTNINLANKKRGINIT